MADVSVQYYLDTPARFLTFNDGGDEMKYITEIQGLASPSLRTPIDNVPFGDGGIVHDFWKGPRHIIVEGILLIDYGAYPYSQMQLEVLRQRNHYEEEMTAALESIIRTDGTFSFTPYQQSSRSYTVRYEVPLEFVHDSSYLFSTFSFGLIAGNPDG